MRPELRPRAPKLADSHQDFSFDYANLSDPDSPAPSINKSKKRPRAKGPEVQFDEGEETRSRAGGNIQGVAWLPKEDEALKNALDAVGKRWNGVANHILKATGSERSAAMCRNRWQRMQVSAKPGRNICKRCGETKRGHTCKALDLVDRLPKTARPIPQDATGGDSTWGVVLCDTVKKGAGQPPKKGPGRPPKKPRTVQGAATGTANVEEAHNLLPPVASNAFTVDADTLLACINQGAGAGTTVPPPRPGAFLASGAPPPICVRSTTQELLRFEGNVEELVDLRDANLRGWLTPSDAYASAAPTPTVDTDGVDNCTELDDDDSDEEADFSDGADASLEFRSSFSQSFSCEPSRLGTPIPIEMLEHSQPESLPDASPVTFSGLTEPVSPYHASPLGVARAAGDESNAATGTMATPVFARLPSAFSRFPSFSFCDQPPVTATDARPTAPLVAPSAVAAPEALKPDLSAGLKTAARSLCLAAPLHA